MLINVAVRQEYQGSCDCVGQVRLHIQRAPWRRGDHKRARGIGMAKHDSVSKTLVTACQDTRTSGQVIIVLPAQQEQHVGNDFLLSGPIFEGSYRLSTSARRGDSERQG